MFLFIILIILFLCAGSIFLTYKISEIEKDLEILYDNYSTQLTNLIQNNLKKGV